MSETRSAKPGDAKQGTNAGPEKKEELARSTAPTQSGQKVNALLEAYLEHVGLGEYASVFRQNGVTSLELLKMLGTPVGDKVKEGVKTAITNGDKQDGTVKRAGSPLGANLVDTISPDDVQAWKERHAATAPKAVASEAEVKGRREDAKDAAERAKADAEKAEQKREEIRKAIAEAEKLRDECAKAAGDLRAKKQEEVAKALDGITARLEKDVLGAFGSLEADARSLHDMFEQTSADLARVNQMTLDSIKKTDMSATALIHAHQLLRGRYVDATGMTEAPGGAVLAMPRRDTDIDLFGPALEMLDFSSSYRSEAEMKRVERVIETSASSFATTAQASGAAFMGTGIGAMSVSAKYAHGKEALTDTATASRASTVTEIQTRYHWAPMRQIVFATHDFELSSEALADLRDILATEANRPERAKAFMKMFGSHVFGRVTLGGWYKYTASATAQSEDQRGKLRSAVAKGMEWAVSASATYIGLGGAGKAGMAAEGKEQEAFVREQEARRTFEEQEVTISTDVLGGTDGLSRPEWLGSLQYPPQWRVIQRDAPLPVWEVIRRTSAARLAMRLEPAKTEPETTQRKSGQPAASLAMTKPETSEKMTETPEPKAGERSDGEQPNDLATLADLFECVWVQQVFAPSLRKEIRERVVKENIRRAMDLETFLEGIEASEPTAPHLSWSEARSDTIEPFRAKSEPGHRPSTGISAAIYRNQLCCFYVTPGPNATIDGMRFDGIGWEWLEPHRARDAVWQDVEVAVIDLQAKDDGGSQFRYDGSGLAITAIVEATAGNPVVGATAGNGLEIRWSFSPPPGNLSLVRSGLGVRSAAVGPALVRLRKEIYVVCADESNNLVSTRLLPEKNIAPGAPKPLKGDSARTDKRVAAAVFKEKLYCAYRSMGTTKLYLMTSDDGKNWSTPVGLPGKGSGDGPALAVFAGRLYCAYRGTGADSPLYLISSSDGSGWSGPETIGAGEDIAKSGRSPALAAFTDQDGPGLYCFYRGVGADATLYYRVATWSSPSPAPP